MDRAKATGRRPSFHVALCRPGQARPLRRARPLRPVPARSRSGQDREQVGRAPTGRGLDEVDRRCHLGEQRRRMR